MQQSHGKMSQICDYLQVLRLNFDQLVNWTLPFVTRRTRFAEYLSKGKTNVAVT
jgi:hypothetical protein